MGSGVLVKSWGQSITSRVNCQSNSSKGRYTRRCVLIRIPEEILSTYSWGSIFAFGLLALTSQGRVLAVGCVIISLLFIGSVLCCVRKHRNSQHSKGNGFPKGEVNLVFVRGRWVKGIRLDKINSAAPHNPSGLSHEVKGYRCLSKRLWALRSGQGSWLQGRGLSLSLSTSSTFSTEQFALIEGFRCDVINITVNPLLVFNPEGQALLSGAQTPQQFWI